MIGGAGQILVPIQALAGSIPVAAQFTVTGTGRKAIIRGQSFSNVTAGSVNITGHWVPSGASPTNANKLFGAVPLAANKTWTPSYLDGEWVMELGDALWFFASAADSINWSVCGNLVVPSQLYKQAV